MKLPAIASDTFGSRYILSEHPDLLFAKEDPHCLAEKIESQFHNRGKKVAPIDLTSFDVKTSADQIIALYKKLTKNFDPV